MNEIEKLIDELAEAYFPERAIGAIMRSDYESALRRVANAAVQSERERCAKVAEETWVSGHEWGEPIAAAIRKGTPE